MKTLMHRRSIRGGGVLTAVVAALGFTGVASALPTARVSLNLVTPVTAQPAEFDLFVRFTDELIAALDSIELFQLNVQASSDELHDDATDTPFTDYSAFSFELDPALAADAAANWTELPPTFGSVAAVTYASDPFGGLTDSNTLIRLGRLKVNYLDAGVLPGQTVVVAIQDDAFVAANPGVAVPFPTQFFLNGIAPSLPVVFESGGNSFTVPDDGGGTGGGVIPEPVTAILGLMGLFAVNLAAAQRRR